MMKTKVLAMVTKAVALDHGVAVTLTQTKTLAEMVPAGAEAEKGCHPLSLLKALVMDQIPEESLEAGEVVETLVPRLQKQPEEVMAVVMKALTVVLGVVTTNHLSLT